MLKQTPSAFKRLTGLKGMQFDWSALKAHEAQKRTWLDVAMYKFFPTVWVCTMCYGVQNDPILNT